MPRRMNASSKEQPRIDSNFFMGNRAKLLAELPDNATVVLTGHSRMQRSRDTMYPFRQESNFWYLTGVNEPEYVLVLTQKESFLISPNRSNVHEVFEGAASADELINGSGVTAVYPEREGWQKIRAIGEDTNTIYTKLPAKTYYGPAGLQLNGAGYRLIQKLKRRVSVELSDVTPALTKLRLIKQPEELKALQQAIAITSEAFACVSGQLDTYSNEREIAADLTHQYLRSGSVHGYEPIVAGAGNACTLHYVRNDQPLEDNHLLLIDSGAEFHGYSADITRTLAIGKPTSRQATVHQAVVDLQRQAFGLFRPGITLKEVEKTFLQYMTASLRQLSLISNEDETRRYYPHALSHFLGLDVHDVGDSDTPLAPGMVLTVEPGIYVPEEGIGVRIEDNILVTDDGYELLTGKCDQPTLK